MKANYQSDTKEEDAKLSRSKIKRVIKDDES